MTTDIFTTCAELTSIRNWVNQSLGYGSTEAGNFWLPIVCTARGVIYAEVIARLEKDLDKDKYYQPYHLRDNHRQPLYRLGFQLLDYLKAPPAVYLLQFDFDASLSFNQSFLFDRLIPFPDKPAIASVGVQEPDLYECHLLCTTDQPIYDLVIKSSDQS
jgi:hypothetical protein